MSKRTKKRNDGLISLSISVFSQILAAESSVINFFWDRNSWLLRNQMGVTKICVALQMGIQAARMQLHFMNKSQPSLGFKPHFVHSWYICTWILLVSYKKLFNYKLIISRLKFVLFFLFSFVVSLEVLNLRSPNMIFYVSSPYHKFWQKKGHLCFSLIWLYM